MTWYPKERQGGEVLTVIVADDDSDVREGMAEYLREDGFRVFEARHGGELSSDLGLLDLHGSESPHEVLVVTDYEMPVADGLSVIRQAQARPQNLSFILITGVSDPGVEREARRLGALAVFMKPFDPVALRQIVRSRSRHAH